LGGLWAVEWAWNLALRKNLRNLHAKSQLPSSYSFRDVSVHTDKRTDGHNQIDSASDPDQEYIYFLLPLTYFPTILVYPFTLRVTGINIA